MKKREPKVGDWIIITNPWGNNWKECGITKVERKAVMGMVGRIKKIQKGMPTRVGLKLDYVIDIVSSKDEIRKTMPTFSGAVWDRSEFEIIFDKSKVFMELI